MRALESRDPERILTTRQEAGDRPVVFLFTGQGSQYPDMGRGLYESEPTFRGEVDRCCELLGPHLGLDLRDLLFPDPADEEAAAERLRQTAVSQPALFVIEYALARLWMQLGREAAGDDRPLDRRVRGGLRGRRVLPARTRSRWSPPVGG